MKSLFTRGAKFRNYVLACSIGLTALLVAGFLQTAATASAQEKQTEASTAGGKFGVGSKAPALNIEHWLSDGNGKFPHTTKLEAGKVYVIEFWATWCGPCVSSMPHLSELQTKFADKGVQIISVSDEDLETVETFLKREVRGKDNQTYAELTSSYSLTTDPDGSTYEAYFEAAGLEGIPSAFIVGKSGEVEWMGHPMEMDEPLAEVVEGTWDRAAFVVKMKEEAEREAAMEKLQMKLGKMMQAVQAKLEAGEAEAGLKLLDEAIADEENAVLKPTLEQIRQQLVVMYVGGEEGAKVLKQIAQKNAGDPVMLNQVAWTIYQQHLEEPVDEAVLSAALVVAEAAVAAAPEEGAILDTLAHLLHAQGKLDQAIEVQEKALKNPGEAEAEIKEFLATLKQEKAGDDSKDSADDQ
jgi:thiol-disulfide isomerase/thioredoxin